MTGLRNTKTWSKSTKFTKGRVIRFWPTKLISLVLRYSIGKKTPSKP